MTDLSTLGKRERTQLWKREGVFFVVEIQVGQVWVEHARASTESEAEKLAAEVVKRNDRAICGVRVHEVETVTVNTVIWSAYQKADIVTIPRGMSRTDAKMECPKCGRLAAVAVDSASHWAVCGHCHKTLPVNMEAQRGAQNS